jgi:hypothetical protein
MSDFIWVERLFMMCNYFSSWVIMILLYVDMFDLRKIRHQKIRHQTFRSISNYDKPSARPHPLPVYQLI